MSTDTTLEIESSNLDQTFVIGEKIGKALRGGELIDLAGDVGSGKTTLVRGIAKGAGSLDKVSSPSFTISRHYRAGQFTIVHFDFYRLNDPGLMRGEFQDYLDDKQYVVLIEWSDKVADLLPDTRATIEISTKSPDARHIRITTAESLTYISDI